ncbi:MAG: right-handed parallel beta-helix repeat-containing protein [Candidatus Eisenbacteria bacterium]|jgi:hypothetical protein|nr:right-handed parallel beta-helix repeat-containing protein [Candidatus Eisenbacteria bacterium]
MARLLASGRPRPAALLAVAALALCPRLCPADVVCIDDDNQTGVYDGTPLHPFSDIAPAIAAAVSGDELRIAAGVYPGNLLVDTKALNLLGGYPGGTASGYAGGIAGEFGTQDPVAQVTHLQGDGSAAVIRFRRVGGVDGSTVVDGLRITGGTSGILFDDEYPSGEFRDFVISRNLIEENGHHDPAYGHRGGGIAVDGSCIRISDNTIRNNTADTGAGIGGAADTLLVENNVIEGNIGFGDHGGGLWLGGEGTLAHNLIHANVIGDLAGYGWGGGVLVVGRWVIVGNTISGNTAPSLGGGLFIDEGAEAWVDHNLIVENATLTEWVKGGAGVYVDGAWDGTPSSAHLTSCTIADNASPGTNGGNGIYVEYSDVDVSGCIFWGNEGGDDFYLDPSSTLTVVHSLSEEPIAGAGNQSADPLFADPPTCDYHLKSLVGRWDPGLTAWVADDEHSPAIDAGDPAAAYSAEPSPNGGRRNAGAYGNTPEASRSCVVFEW